MESRSCEKGSAKSNLGSGSLQKKFGKPRSGVSRAFLPRPNLQTRMRSVSPYLGACCREHWNVVVRASCNIYFCYT